MSFSGISMYVSFHHILLGEMQAASFLVLDRIFSLLSGHARISCNNGVDELVANFQSKTLYVTMDN
jgi:hypothetical protein